MLRSGWTFPTISTALLMVRWESCIHACTSDTWSALPSRMKKQGKLKRKKKKRRRRKEDGKKQETYAVEVDGDGSVRFDRCCFATQRHNLAEDADGLVGESLKIGSMDTRRSFRGGHVFLSFFLN